MIVTLVRDLWLITDVGFLGVRVGEIPVIFKPRSTQVNTRHPLAYVHWFRPLQQFDHTLHMFRLSRSSRQNGPYAEVIPVDHILRPCHLVPQWPRRMDAGFNMDEVDKFLLNKYIDSDLFESLDSVHVL